MNSAERDATFKGKTVGNPVILLGIELISIGERAFRQTKFPAKIIGAPYLRIVTTPFFIVEFACDLISMV
jgi:hypothetical protein